MARGGYRPGSGPAKGTKYRLRGVKPTSGVVQKRIKKPGKASDVPADIIENAVTEKLDPLSYMLKVMNDPNEDKELRARMAIAAAPFIHARKGEGAGKKEEKADRAKAAGSGKFAASKPPISLVR